MDIQRSLGADNFPLISQNYYPDHRTMVSCPRLYYLVLTSLYLRNLQVTSPVCSRLVMHMVD